MGRAPCCDKASVKKGPWSPEEDAKLKSYIEQHGTGGNWIALPQKIGLKRCGKSCRLRWLNYLRPNIKHGGFSEEEDSLICSLYVSIGSRWSIIAAQLPGRTDNDIKNYWNTRLKKKLLGKQRQEHGWQGNNHGMRKRELKSSKGSMVGRENPMEYPNSFNGNQIAPYWPELPTSTQTTIMPRLDLEGSAFDDCTSIRKLLIKLGGRFSDHDSQEAIQNGQSSFQQLSICQSSSSASQNPNCGHDPSMAMLPSPSATAATPQLVAVPGGITVPCGAEGRQCFADPQMPFDGLEFLLGEGIEIACTGAASVNWKDMSSMVCPNSTDASSSYGICIQNGLLQECGFGNDHLRHSMAQ